MNVLFIGNSHTYLHYMPQMLGELVRAADSGFQLNIDQITAAKFIALVFAVLDDVNAVVAPVAKHGSSLIFLGSLSQIQYNAQQGWGHGFSPF